ncbi:MAG TPA: DUF3999 family protein [Cellvibrio sp.]|nr:DUF3999 family protein [Cellvibrio sp.]
MKCVAKYLYIGGFLWGASAIVNADVIPVYQIKETAGTYLQTDVTHDIYRYSSNTQLNDLVITDKQGNKLPYHLAAPSTHISEQSQQIPIHFFPVAVGAPPEALLALSSASIRLDDNEISVSVEKAANDNLQDKAAPIDFFVVDLSDLRTRADKLVVDWQVNETNQYLEVHVSGTNDLTNWDKITQNTLVQLQKDGQQLKRNKISINLKEKQYAYLRLKFTRGAEQLQIGGIYIENTDKIPNAPPADSWQVTGELADEQESALRSSDVGNNQPLAAWEFTRDDIAPVNSISLNLGKITYGDTVKVFSRATEKQPWHLVHQGIWFNTQVGNDWQQSDALRIDANSHTHWRVEFNQLMNSTTEPTLVFHRQAQTLQFIANNSAPYNIAIDDQAAPNNQQTNAQIFSQLISGKELQWTQVNVTELNPDIDLFAHHATIFSWKTLLFWGILFLAVGILVFVAVRLMGQMKNSTLGAKNE